MDELRVKLQFGGYHHLVEADIKGFFDHSSLAAEASIHEEPGAGKPHAGIGAVLSGNWQSYRDQLLIPPLWGHDRVALLQRF